MQDSNLGQNLAVMRGHSGPINLIAFHPTLPLALLSASNDGTVRLWDASDPHFPPFLLTPAGVSIGRQPSAGAAGGDNGEEGVGVTSPTALAAAEAAGAAANAGRGTGSRVARVAANVREVLEFMEVGGLARCWCAAGALAAVAV